MRVRHMVVEVLQPGQAENDRPEEEAAVDVGPGEHDDRDRPQAPGVRPPVRHEHQHDREQGHPDELRPEREGDGRHEERREGEERGIASHQPAPPSDEEQAAEDDPGQRRAQEDETRPRSELVDGGQDDLGAPLLVGPWLAEGRERPGVGRGDPVPGQDPGASPQVVGQVHARQVGQDGRDRGQRDGKERPQARHRHRWMLASAGAAAHRDVGTGRDQTAATSDGRIARAPSS